MNNLVIMRIVCLAIGYVFGLFQTAYIYGKSKGIDIREHGSGNAGTTNALRVLGPSAGLVVLLGDMLKCLIPVLLVGFLFRGQSPEVVYLLKAWTFAGVVLGHDFPFYMGFKGGKGVAVMAGFVFGFHWILIPVGIALFFIPYGITKYVSLGSLLAYLGIFITAAIGAGRGLFGTPGSLTAEMAVIIGILAAMSWYRHRANIGRLLSGTERKTYIFKR